ncbi:synapsin-1-like [Bacillus rossius redtenbacheri]|uniref:synapsin-1-like n=1 Tax=Bacillus rossius redtenbacheri TaxID=93214 RepID=UPI002FDD48AD
MARETERDIQAIQSATETMMQWRPNPTLAVLSPEDAGVVVRYTGPPAPPDRSAQSPGSRECNLEPQGQSRLTWRQTDRGERRGGPTAREERPPRCRYFPTEMYHWHRECPIKAAGEGENGGAVSAGPTGRASSLRRAPPLAPHHRHPRQQLRAPVIYHPRLPDVGGGGQRRPDGTCTESSRRPDGPCPESSASSAARPMSSTSPPATAGSSELPPRPPDVDGGGLFPESSASSAARPTSSASPPEAAGASELPPRPPDIGVGGTRRPDGPCPESSVSSAAHPTSRGASTVDAGLEDRLSRLGCMGPEEGSLLRIPVRVDGRELEALVDTAASHSYIAAHLVAGADVTAEAGTVLLATRGACALAKRTP